MMNLRFTPMQIRNFTGQMTQLLYSSKKALAMVSDFIEEASNDFLKHGDNEARLLL